MTKERKDAFLRAVDAVCGECAYLAEDICMECPVRKTCDGLMNTPYVGKHCVSSIEDVFTDSAYIGKHRAKSA